MGHQGTLLDRFPAFRSLIGIGSLDGENVNSKRLLSSWTLHFAAKVTSDAI